MTGTSTGGSAGRAGSDHHSRASRRLLFGVIAAVVIVDQLTKAWAVSTLTTRTIHIVWTLQLRLAYNTGMAFGTGRGIGPVIGAVAMVVVVGMLVTMRRGGGRVADIAVGLVVGGAIGNLLDRLFRGQGFLRGGVVDFIDFQWFPIFNVADMAITIGGAILLLSAYLHRPTVETTSAAITSSDESGAESAAESAAESESSAE